jgi:alpha-beta hydrolase superfamily lysophospholipase
LIAFGCGWKPLQVDMHELNSEIKETLTADGVKLRYREWNPETPRGVVIGIHGIRSHGAWYNDSCTHLCRSGYRVLFADRRGSGLNREEMRSPVSYQRWIGDLEHFIGLAARELPGKPVHLLGISWGGRLAAAVAAAGRVQLKSLIFSAPGLVSLRDYSLRTKLAVAIALLLKNDREFVIPLEDPALFTDDPDERNYIEEDAFGLRRVTARFLLESRRLERCAKTGFAAIRIPLLLLLAGRDQIVDNGAVKELFHSCASGDKVIKIYEKARHTLEFDPCREEYYSDLVRWLDNHG